MAKINFSNVAFLGAFVDADQVKSLGYSEFIIIGRSNVGKSSLINALTKKTIAKTSSTPGKTETINHFSIDNKISIYDLPGYGFAKFKDKRHSWASFIDRFIESKGDSLSAFLILIDSRHDISEEDAAMITYLNNFKAPLVVILTKIDKLTPAELKKNLEILSSQIKALYLKNFEIFPFSTKISQHCKNLEKMMSIWAN